MVQSQAIAMIMVTATVTAMDTVTDMIMGIWE